MMNSCEIAVVSEYQALARRYRLAHLASEEGHCPPAHLNKENPHYESTLKLKQTLLFSDPNKEV